MAEGVSQFDATHLGARWVRAALQVNPYNYHGKNAPSSNFPDEQTYNTELLARCKTERIEIVAITDHWCVDSAVGLLKAAEDADIAALPGFEANSSEGVHLLIIFERGTPLADINAAIGQCEVSPGCTNGTTGAAYKEILQKMTDRGALVIPAHANVANSGMFTRANGMPLVAMVKNPALHAIAVTPSTPATTEQPAILGGQAPYKRKHPPSTIYADDICRPDALATVGATTWFKVSSLRLESLKLAVRTPATRVAFIDPAATPRALIREITWTGGFLDGVRLPIADDLTALIGGRGTGKSTVVESLRYALGLDALGEDARRDHDGIITNVLGSGTTVQLVVDAVAPQAARYTIERSVPNPPVVRDSSGTATSLRPVDMIGPVEIFGQHELAELAQDKTSVARMIERFSIPSDITDGSEIILEALKENRDKIKRVEAKSTLLEDELADVPRLEAQQQRYTETDVVHRLGDMKRLNQDEAVFKEGAQRVTTVEQVLDEFLDEDLIQSIEITIGGIEGSSQQASLARVSAATNKLGAVMRQTRQALREAAEAAKQEIVEAKAEWISLTETERSGHNQVLRELREEGHNPEQYLTTTRNLDALKAKIPQRTNFATQLATLQKERDRLLGKLTAQERADTEMLHAAIRAANEATNGAVNVRPVASPDRTKIRRAIERAVKGQRTQIMTAVAQDNFSPRAFVSVIRAGAEKLETEYGIRGAQAASLVGAGESLLRELEEMNVGQAVDVYLDTDATDTRRSYRRLEDLSKGQRATALLLLLLGASTSPLIIDQPEDDLDNRFVYDGIVQKLRELKGSRQIIVSTHNANVPVLGDAELIIAPEGGGNKGWPIADGIGSLDNATVRKLAENLLEGGPAAFDARQHLYGF